MNRVNGDFCEDHRLVGGVPECLAEQVIDEDSCVGFSRIMLHSHPAS
jgi:hypothetical protein